MLFAFSRDGAVPGHRMWTRLNHHCVPANAVLLICFLALVLTAPALERRRASSSTRAVMSIATIGLYVAYVIPIYLRWRAGRLVRARARGRSGRWYKPLNPVAILWVTSSASSSSCPSPTPASRWRDEFD